MALDSFFALVMLAALITYALLAGADFGAGVWDLLSSGPRRAAQRRAIAEAIGPVWEANHVWLIFFIVLLFTCFPLAYAAISTALFWPLHLVLIGIVLRGSAFVFRAYGAPTAAAQAAWGHIFGAASAVSPILLGMCLGAISTGAIGVVGGTVSIQSGSAWRAPFPAATGILALLLCAYLAAVYLAWESRGDLQADFSRRAFGRARVLGAAQVVVLLAGWAVAQWPYLVYPDVTVAGAAAPPSTLSLTAATLPLGVAAVVPSLWWLFAVFKERNPQSRGE
jgi:cytochrome bd ubiquinol oxidase subunit II